MWGGPRPALIIAVDEDASFANKGKCATAGQAEGEFMTSKRGNRHRLAVLPLAIAIIALQSLNSECRAGFSDQTAALIPQGYGSDGLNGVMWGNINNDGFIDLATPSGGYINNDGTNFSDGGPNNSIWADYNNDGYDDISFGKIFASNAQGNATFFVTDHGDAGGNLFWPGTSHHRAFGDLDNNGFVDLYACGGEGAVNPDNIFLNFGSQYTNAWSGNGGVYSRGVTMCDFDKDGDLDIYVSNYWLAQDNLWVNNGSATFTDEAVARGINNAGHGLGADWCDLDNDGDFDLAMANLDHGGQPPTAFWRNSGAPNYTFTNGFTAPYVERYASPAAGDYDNDGDLDVYIADLDGTPKLLRNDGGFSFTDVTAGQGIPAQGGTGVGWADYDNDGDLDLATPTKILRNDLVHGAGTHWLKVKLVGDGVQINKSAIGTQCFIDLGGGTILSRQVSTSAGERNSKVHTLHYGLGTQTTPVDLDICWPGGVTTSVSNVSVDQLVTINFITTTSTSSTSTLTSSTSSTTTTSSSTSSSTTLTNSPPYEEPFEEYADGLSLHNTNGWHGAPGAATISTDATWINRLTDYINAGLDYPLPSEPHAKIMCVTEGQSISNRIQSAWPTVFTDFLWLQASGPNPPQDGKAPPADGNDQYALYVDKEGKLNIWHDDFGTPEFLTLAASPVIATGAWTRITIEQNYTGNRYRVRVNQGPEIQDAKGWNSPVGGSQPGTWFNMVKKNGSMSRFVVMAFNGDAYVDDLQVKLVTPFTTTSTSSSTITSTTSSTTTTSTTSTSTTSTSSTTTIFTTSTTSTSTTSTTSTSSTTSPFGGSHDVTYNYTGGYFSFELGDIDPGLAFGHGFLTPGSGDSARFDFWFAPDGVVDGSGVDGGGGATAGDNYAAGGDDIFMGSRVVNEDGVDQYMGGAGLDIDSFAPASPLTNFTGAGFADGTVAAYGRVFENDNPQAGDWYYVGASEVVRNQDVPANPPNSVAIGRGLGLLGLDPIDGTQWSFQVSAGLLAPVIVDVNADVTLWAVYTPTGTITPMYSTNLGTVPIEWITVPVFSNTFVTGTNVIMFDPPATNGADVHFHLLQTF